MASRPQGVENKVAATDVNVLWITVLIAIFGFIPLCDVLREL